MQDRVEILNLFEMPDIAIEYAERKFKLHHIAAPADQRDEQLARIGPSIRGIVTGTGGRVDEALLARLPNVEVISCYSAGLEPVDLEAAARRGIVVRSGSRALADAVGEMALALLLSLARNIVPGDILVREGRWAEARAVPGNLVRGRRMGIVGLGTIGKSIAARAAPFGIEIAYCGRNRQADQPYEYFPEVRDLARWADILMLSCPGGEETFHLVDRETLEALGPNGWLVNVARGSVVDEAALIEALDAGTIAGAALDVFENEPTVPEGLRHAGRVVLAPHLGSGASEITPFRARYLIDVLSEQLG